MLDTNAVPTAKRTRFKPAAGIAALNVQAAVEEVAGDIAGRQPLDATLTALAAQNWVANALPIGAGADTVAQITFAANTFPARASTGNLVAKTITDFALTILDDADAASVRTTIGAGSGSGDALVASTLDQFADVTQTATKTLAITESTTLAGGTHSGTNTGDQSRASLGIDTTDAVTFGDLTVSNLVVNGTTTTVNTATLTVDDPLIALGDGNGADSVDLGVYGSYTSGGVKYTGLFRDASDGKFKAFTGLEEAPTSTVNIAGTGYTVATIVASLEGNAATATILATARNINGVAFDGSGNITVTAAGSTLSDTVTVAKGGTGLTALGSALQVLRTNAGATAMEWATASGGGDVATDAIWDAKGDLAVGTGANTASRLAVGTNGQFLKADSTQATGLIWATLAGGGDALVANPLSQFAATTSAQLAGVISDETGSGALCFAISPTLTTPRIANAGYIADANGNEQIIFTTTASAVNEITLANAATGNAPTLKASGGDTNVGLSLSPKGSGSLKFLDGTDSTKQLVFMLANSTTGAQVTFNLQHSASGTITFPDGSQTLAGLTSTQTLSGKTLTAPRFATGGYIADNNGNEQIVFTTTTSAVNEIGVTNAATGNAPSIKARGGDTNVPLLLTGKGTGKVRIGDAADATKLMAFELVGATAAKTVTVTSSHTDDRTITLPNATDTLVGKATTDTLTNKRITKRIQAVSTAATITPNADNDDAVDVTALAEAATFAAPSGTPTNGQSLIITIKDNSTPRALTWNSAYSICGASLPTTTVAGKIHVLGFRYSTANTLNKWQLLVANVEA